MLSSHLTCYEHAKLIGEVMARSTLLRDAEVIKKLCMDARVRTNDPDCIVALPGHQAFALASIVESLISDRLQWYEDPSWREI